MRPMDQALDPDLDYWIDRHTCWALDQSGPVQPGEPTLRERLAEMPDAIARTILAIMYVGRGDGDLRSMLQNTRGHAAEPGTALSMLCSKERRGGELVEKAVCDLQAEQIAILNGKYLAVPTRKVDLIGDIHGHYHELCALLEKLGYETKGQGWRHPEGRRVVYVGDYIDRGPEIRSVLTTVRSMVEAGEAVALMGNHEFNAIAWATPAEDRAEGWCREHSESKTRQHQATLDQLHPDELREWVEWFRTLPVSWRGEGIRAVHACWDDARVQMLEEALRSNGWTDDLIRLATNHESDLYHAVEVVLKGLEVDLPHGRTFTDKDGNVRSAARVQWWRRPTPHESLGNWLMPPIASVEEPVGDLAHVQLPEISEEDPITAIGHYWLRADRPEPMHPKVVCLDYSVAKGGQLCAYRHGADEVAEPEHFITT